MHKQLTRTAVIYTYDAAMDGDDDAELPDHIASLKVEATRLEAYVVEVFCDRDEPMISEDEPIAEHELEDQPEEQPELQNMLDFVRKNKVDYVVVKYFYFISCDIKELLKIVDAIEKAGAKLISSAGEEQMLPIYRIQRKDAISSVRLEKPTESTESKDCESAVCEDCKQQKSPGNGCMIEEFNVNGKKYSRIKAGVDLDFGLSMNNDGFCHGCSVKQGQYHHYGCDSERCPLCDGQLIRCDCEVEIEAVSYVETGKRK